MRRIAFVGAGVSGLVTAKTLLDLGHEVVIYDALPEVGGVWAAANRYPGLPTQSPKRCYGYSD